MRRRLPLAGLRYVAAARQGALRIIRLAKTPAGEIVMDGSVHPIELEPTRYHRRVAGYVIFWRGWRLVVRSVPDWAFEAASFMSTSVLWAGLLILANLALHHA